MVSPGAGCNLSGASCAANVFELFVVVLAVMRKDVVSSWLVKFVQLPVEDEDVEAFRPSPLQLSLVIVVVEAPAIKDEAAPTLGKSVSEITKELHVDGGDGCIFCTCSLVPYLSPCTFVRFLFCFPGVPDSFFS